MFALVRLAEGLIVVHLFVAIAYTIGANAMEWDRRPSLPAPEAMIKLVCASGLGFAFIGLGAFAVASLGWFRPLPVALMLPVLFFGGCLACRCSPLRAAYWRKRWTLVLQAFDFPNLAVYYALLVVSVPAVNLVNAGADPLAYHWAYAMDWINAHGLIVDPFLREPFYAQNDLFAVALLMLFGGDNLAQFAMWGFGLATALAVCAGVRAAFSTTGAWQNAFAVLLGLAVAYSPTYLRWMDSGYLDVVLGFYALISVIALQQALREGGDWRWLGVSAVLAAFLIGSKTSLLPFVFVYGLVFAVAAGRLKCSLKQAALVLGILAVLSAPWYARNLALAGDVIPPLFNIALHGRDGLFTKADVQEVAQDLRTDHGPKALLTLPARAFLTPDTRDFREYAQNALILLLYVPTAMLLFVRLILHRKLPPALTAPVVLLTTMIGYWLFTSTSMRYCLLFFPLLGLCCGLWAARIKAPIRYAGPALTALALALFVITPTAEAHTFYANYFIDGVENSPKYYDADQPFLKKFVDGYAEEQFTAQVRRRLGLHGRVYLLANPINYYYRRDGMESIGDWVGPAGVYRLYRALDGGEAADFLNAFDVDSFVLDPQRVFAGLQVPLERRLEQHGYCALPIPSSRMTLLVRAGVSCNQVRYQLRSNAM